MKFQIEFVHALKILTDESSFEIHQVYETQLTFPILTIIVKDTLSKSLCRTLAIFAKRFHQENTEFEPWLS